MEITWEFIKSHPVLMIMVFLPIAYIVCRDLFLFILRRRELEKQREVLVDTESRVETLMRTVENNRAKLLEDIKSLDLNSEETPPPKNT